MAIFRTLLLSAFHNRPKLNFTKPVLFAEFQLRVIEGWCPITIADYQRRRDIAIKLRQKYVVITRNNNDYGSAETLTTLVKKPTLLHILVLILILLLLSLLLLLICSVWRISNEFQLKSLWRQIYYRLRGPQRIVVAQPNETRRHHPPPPSRHRW